MFRFITKRPFWVNLLVAIALAFLLVFLFLQMLGWITRHGEHLTVPSVIGKKTDEAIKFLKDKGFDVQIVDSVYTDTTQNGIVLKQLPDADATVKVNRTVFLTVNRVVPPMINMPKLEGQSLNFALDLLARNHLQLGDTIFQQNFMQGSVLEQQYNGKRIEENAKVQWGSKITLIVGGGLGDQQMLVPDLSGMTVGQVKTYLQDNGLVLGALVSYGTISDTAAAFVYKQNPAIYNEKHLPNYIRAGQIVDLYISAEMISSQDSTVISP